MNQSVLFSDGFTYEVDKQAIVLDAQVSGQLIKCFITGIDFSGAPKVYDAFQFDFEEYLTELIEEQGIGLNGSLTVSFSMIGKHF